MVLKKEKMAEKRWGCSEEIDLFILNYIKKKKKQQKKQNQKCTHAN